MNSERVFLAKEIDLLRGQGELLSTNIKLRLDGQPMSGQAQPHDPGAAVYFKLKGRDVALACDKWLRVEHNIRAIALHISSLRGQQRWGVGNVEQAFRGYMALPAVGASTGERYHEVLGIAINASEAQITEAFRMLSKRFHPDIPETGDADRFRRIQTAYEMLKQNLKKSP